MTTRRFAMIAAISALGGLVGGAFGASWYWQNFYTQFMTSNLVLRTQADIITRVSVLEHIRAGRPENATKLLETLVDGDLIGAGALARDGHKFNANARRAVALELRARKVSGYEPTDPTVRAGVQEAFRLLHASADAVGAQPDAAGDAQKTARP